jgi:hypothetical protein
MGEIEMTQIELVAFKVVTTRPGTDAHNRALVALAALAIGTGQHPADIDVDDAVEVALTFPRRCGSCGEADRSKGSHGLGRCKVL